MREDIRMKSKAEQLGFIVDTKGDVYNGTNELIICKGDPYAFKKGNKIIWYSGYVPELPYRCCDIIDEISKNHRSYPDLETAINKEN